MPSYFANSATAASKDQPASKKTATIHQSGDDPANGEDWGKQLSQLSQRFQIRLFGPLYIGSPPHDEDIDQVTLFPN